jgi:sec-independent protein translocase protein TatC
MNALLEDDDIKILIYSPAVSIADAKDAVYDTIISGTEKKSILDILSLYILGESDMNFSMVLDAVMQGGTERLTLEDLPDTSEVIIFQTIPYEEKVVNTDAIDIAGTEFENITGRKPLFTVVHIEKDEKGSSNRPIVVYTKPLEVPLLKLKMSIIIAFIATLPFLFYIAGKEVTKYVDVKKLKLSERMPFKKKWPILIVLVMFISFVLGALFSYFFMSPLFIQLLYLSAAASGAQATYSIYEFVSFIAMLSLIFGFTFELPLVIFLLNRLGLVQKRMLTKYRRHAYVMFFILAALITPPDVFSLIIVAIPMIIFYEFSILIVKIFGRKDPPAGTRLV